MKILHALGWFFPESVGGTEVYVAALAHRMLSSGHRIGVVAPKSGIGSGMSYSHEGASVHRYPIPLSMSRSEAQGRAPLPSRDCFADIIKQEQPDVVHFHTFCSGLGVHEVAVAKDAGAVVIATNHLPSIGYVCQRGTLMQWGESPCDGVCRTVKCASCELQRKGLPRTLARSVAVLGLAFRRTESMLPAGRLSTGLLMADLIEHNQRTQARLIRLLDRFVFLNRRALNIALANGADPRKTSLSYLGSSHRQAGRKPGADTHPTKSPIRIGFLGRFTEDKGIADIARAVRSLPREVDIMVELRGPLSGDESIALTAAVGRIIGDDPRLRIAPAVPLHEVPAALSGYDVLCVPSRGFENGPTVVVEAQAVGTPVVGTTAGAMPELIRHGIDGILVEPGDWQALALAFRRMAEDPEGTIDLWRRNIPCVRGMDEIADEYLAMYEELRDARPK